MKLARKAPCSSSMMARVLPTAIFLMIASPSHSDSSKAVESNKDRSLALFRDYVEPLLKKHCYECHSHASGEANGGLVVDSRGGLLTGGELGPAVKPGEPQTSLLMKAVLYEDDRLSMPPTEKLSERDIDHLREWIETGAVDPREGPAISSQIVKAVQGPDASKLWSVKPLSVGAAPPIVDMQWPRTDIDRFLLAELETKGLSPSPAAPAHQLLRRLHYVCTGLPPTPEESRAFVQAMESTATNPSPAASKAGIQTILESTIDRLLSSPHFGERWGRHWLDLMRYADVAGNDQPNPMPEAWRYRGYVIHAFNQDKAFDEFIREQIAGDLEGIDQPETRAENLVATTMLAIGHVVKADRDAERQKLDVMDEQMEVIGRSLLGIQIGCARCHDHKLDPFPTRDYYALAGIFRSTEGLGGRAPKGDGLLLKPPSVALPEVDETAPSFLRGGKKVNAHAALDTASIRDEAIHLRGEVYVTGDVVPRGLPTLVAKTAIESLPSESSGRRELCDWLLSEKNVLVQRVIANRIWHHVFGQGIVRTTDNFGFTGDAPSHPILLDYLADRFRNHHRGSFKAMIKELLLSRAWQQASTYREEGERIDPENRLLWRANPRRAEAEPLVDMIQFVAGRLDVEPLNGNGVPAFKSGNQFSTADLAIPEPILRKRAVYWPVFRKDVPVVMDALSIFDQPPATNPRGQRAVTHVPSQSLVLQNSSLVLNSSRFLSLSLTSTDEKPKLDELYIKLFARRPDSTEAERCFRFLDNFEEDLADAKAASEKNARNVAWNRLSHTLLISNEFIVIP